MIVQYKGVEQVLQEDLRAHLPDPHFVAQQKSWSLTGNRNAFQLHNERLPVTFTNTTFRLAASILNFFPKGCILLYP